MAWRRTGLGLMCLALAREVEERELSFGITGRCRSRGCRNVRGPPLARVQLFDGLLPLVGGAALDGYLASQGLAMQDSSVGDCEAEAAQQFLKGALDLCLLAVISAEPSYGYGMTQRLARDGISVAGGSIYPALGRLRRAGLVVIEERDGEASGPGRSYYSLTPEGEQRLVALAGAWEHFNSSVGDLLRGTGAAHGAPRKDKP